MSCRAVASRRRRVTRRTRGSAVSQPALALLAPRVSEACAVCISARDDGTQLGFLLGTLIMTPLPFLVIGSIVFFLWRRTRSAALEVSRSSSSRHEQAGAGPGDRAGGQAPRDRPILRQQIEAEHGPGNVHRAASP